MTEDGTGNPNFNTDVIIVVNLVTSHLAFVIYPTTQSEIQTQHKIMYY